jgi:hypothetical protein
MKIGIIGLPQVGKKTLFELLTSERVSDGSFAGSQEVKLGVANIKDERFEGLAAMYKPKKEVPATLNVTLLPRFDKETIRSGEFLKAVEKCDALCHIVRAFHDESVFHAEGSVDPERDIENVYAELILSDLMLVEKRLERIAAEADKGVSSPVAEKEKIILTKLKALLDQNLPVSRYAFHPEEKKLMATYQFLTLKEMIIVLNVDDDKLGEGALIERVKEKFQDYGFHVMQISAQIEVELASLDTAEKEAFLQDLNIKSSALNQLCALCYEALGLLTFFTVGEDEVRAWTTPQGSSAPEAAGVIHSDLQRGFIRAEIMKCADLLSLGSESKVKEAGKFLVKGKDYILEEGDIMNVRFNV